MVTDKVGLKYGYNVTESNKMNLSNANAYSRMTKEASASGLEDTQVVTQTPSANGQNTSGSFSKNAYSKQNRFNPNESVLSGEINNYSPKNTEEEKAVKKKTQELQDKIINAGNTDKRLPLDNDNKITNHSKHDKFDKNCPLCECDTCKNRRYQDDSNDSAVSFQSPTKMNPNEASFKVKSHEMEHVRREQHKAKEEGNRIVSQSVQIMTDTCPECGKMYVAGGFTRTQVKSYNPDFIDLFKVGADDITRKKAN